MLTLRTAIEAINHKLGIDDGEPLDRLSIINSAGAILYAHPWRWLESEIWTLSIGRGSDRVPMPDGLGEVLDVMSSDAYSFTVRYCPSYGDLMLAKSRWPTTQDTRSILVSPFNETRAGESKAWLAIWPTQSDAVENALLIRGRRRWVDIVDDAQPDSSYIVLPRNVPLLKTLMLELIRAYASGWSRDGVTDVQEQVQRIVSGPVWAMAIEQDSRAFSLMSFARNTSIGMARRHRSSAEGDLENYTLNLTP